MRGIVAYDSVYGNTEQVARAIAEQVKSDGHEVELMSLKGGGTKPVTGDFMFLGSPTRVGRPTGAAKDFVNNLSVDQWRNKPIVIFDTVGPLPKDDEKRKVWLERIEKSAASRLRDLASERGLTIHPVLLHLAVTGFKGPLAPDSLDRAREFTHNFVTTLS